jgi:hypothetical protein
MKAKAPAPRGVERPPVRGGGLEQYKGTVNVRLDERRR